MTPEDLRRRFQDALDEADDKLTVGEAMREVMFLFATFTVAENVAEEQMAAMYLQTVRQMRAALGDIPGGSPAEG